jgi:hypothetical protein
MYENTSLGAADAAAVLENRGGLDGDVVVQLSGTFVGTVTFEATLNGTNYVTCEAQPIAGGASVTTAAATGIWRLRATGLKARVRCSAYTSGTIVVAMAAAKRA